MQHGERSPHPHLASAKSSPRIVLGRVGGQSQRHPARLLGDRDMFSLGFRVINSHRKGSLPLIAGNVASRRVLPCAGFYHARFLKCLIDEQLHLRTLPQKHMNSSLEVLHQEAACNHRVGTNSHWFLGSIAACLFQRTVSSMRKFDCCFRYVRAPDRCAADGLSPRDS